MIATESQQTEPSSHVLYKSRAQWWIFGSLVLATLGTCLGVVFSAEPDAIEVRVTSPSFQDLETSVSSIGKVTPVNDFQARANFSGMVEKVFVKAGDTVHPGQLLIQMKDAFAAERVANANASLQSAQVANENIQHNGSQEDRINFTSEKTRAQMEQAAAAGAVETMKQLEKNGTVSAAEVGASNYRLQVANTNLQAINERSKNRYSAKDINSWKARVAQAQAALAGEKVSFANANITSPIEGTVYLLPVSAYDFVPMGADLLRVANLNAVQIHANFDEMDLGKISVGQPVTILWDGKQNHPWHGHVSYAPLAAVASGPRSLGECIIAVDDAKGDLPAGINATVVVTTQKRSHLLTIPREALHTEGGASFVYRVVNGKLLRTSVDAGMINLARVEITKGLGLKDIVALHATTNQELADNLKVKPIR